MSDAVADPSSTEHVRSVLAFILGAAGDGYGYGYGALLAQVPHVTVVAGPLTMLDLRVDRGRPVIWLLDGPLPLIISVSDERRTPVGELLVWVSGGLLSALEYAWWSDEPPFRLPLCAELSVARR